MRTISSLAVALAAALSTPGPSPVPPAPPPVPRTTARFELNRGQLPDGWDMVGRCRRYVAFVRAGRIAFVFGGRRVDLVADGVAAGATPDVRGFETASRANYLLGNDPSRWRRDVPVTTGATYADGATSWTVRAHGAALEFAWTLDGTTEPSFRLDGADAPRVDEAGRLRVPTPDGVATLSAPIAWQDVDGARRAVSAAYRVAADGRVRIALGARDASRPVTIDPTVDFETYLGGTRPENTSIVPANNAATNAVGDAFFCGDTLSTTFPNTAGAYQTNNASSASDIWIACVRAGAMSFSWCTYLGGTSNEYGNRVLVDSAGNVVVSGTSSSSNFPTTSGVVGASYPGGTASVRAKLTGDGAALVWSTFLPGVAGTQFALGPNDDVFVPTTTGVRKYAADMKSIAWTNVLTPSTTIGSQTTSIVGLAVDAADQVHVVGSTNQTNFALTPGTYQTSFAGGTDGLVVKCDAAGGVVWATLVGGTGDDVFGRVGVDAQGRVVVGGATTSGTFPTTAGAFQTVYGGGVRDGMVARLSSDGHALQWSTLLGGIDVDNLSALSVHPCGAVVVAGTTLATGMPVKNAFQSSPGGGSQDGWITVFDSGGTVALSSLVGGSSTDYGTGAAWTREGGVVATGWTGSLNFPLVAAPQTSLADGMGGADAWCLRLADALAGTPDAPVITTSSLADATSSTQCSRGLAATAGSGGYSWEATSGQLPTGLTLAPTGVISGVPLVDGTFAFAVRVVDGYGVAARRSLSMRVNRAPKVTTTLAPWTRGQAYDVQLAASDGTGAIAWDVSSGAAPAGLALSTSGRLSGAPTASGQHSFTARATDVNGAAATKALTLVVAEPPSVVGRALPPAAVGRQYRALPVVVAGTAPGAWSKASGEFAPGLAIDPASGLVGGKPSAPASSRFTLQFADAAQATATGEFSVECFERAVLTKKRASGLLAVADGGPDVVRRYVELTAKCLLDVTVAGGGAAGVGPSVRLRSPSGADVPLGAALTTTAKGAKMKKFEVPTTGRWFLEIESAAGFVGKMKFTIAIAPPTKRVVEATVDSAGAALDVAFAAPPGSRVTVVVKPAKKSPAKPKLVFLMPVGGSDLLTGGTTKTAKNGTVTFTTKATLAGGDHVLRVTSEPGAAGPVVVTVTLRPPGAYGFEMSGVAAGE